MLRQFIRDIGVYGFSGMLVRMISFLLIPLYVRVLSTEDYGIIDLITLIGTLSGVMLSLELYQSVARYFVQNNTDRRREFASTGLMFYFFSYILFTTLMFIFAVPLSELIFSVKGREEVFKTAILSMPVTALFNYLQNLLRYSLQSVRFSIINIFYSITTLSLSAFFVVVLNKGLSGVYLGLILGGIPAIILSAWYNRSYLTFTWNMRVMKQMLNFSLPLTVSALAIYSLTYFDRLLIRHFLSLSDLGVYAVAFRIAAIPVVILSIVNSSLMPLIYKHYRNKNIGRDLKRIYSLVFCGGIAVIILLSLLSKPIISIITTPEYFEAAGVLPLLLFSGFIIQFASLFAGLGLAEKTGIIALIYIGGLILNLTLNYLLIPSVGIIGAGWSASASATLIFVLQGYFSEKYFSIWTKRKIDKSLLN